MKKKLTDWYIEIVVAIFVVLLLYTALEKLKDVDGFVHTIEAIELMKPVARLTGWLVPFIELAIVPLLAWQRTRLLGLQFATALMISFTAYVAYMLLSQSKLPCTCGGVIEKMNWRDHLLFNSTITIVGIIAILVYPKIFARTNRISRTPV